MTPAQEDELRRWRDKLAAGLTGATFEEKVRVSDVLAVACLYDGDTGDLAFVGYWVSTR